MANFGLHDYHPQTGRLILVTPHWDFDRFALLAEPLITQLSASVIEKQCDADIHTWLIDFEGCQLFLKAEHYSESVWLEALDIKASKAELDYLAGLFRRGF